MNLVEITSLETPELDAYARLTEAQLRNRLEPEKGVFIAESPKVIARALDAGMQPLSLLMARSHLGECAKLIAACGDIPVYTGDDAILEDLTGFKLTREELDAQLAPFVAAIVAPCASRWARCSRFPGRASARMREIGPERA